MKREDLISVIVPVYNVEKCLHRCVDSILAQTYQNLEIILVNDGSPDNCGMICDQYARQDSRIRVIHQENGGLSAARNAGLDMASGEYVAFVDSDDYILPTMYEEMYACARDMEVDICVCPWQFEFDDGRQVVDISKFDPTFFGAHTSASFASFLYKGTACENGVVVAAWNKLYRRSIFSVNRFEGRLYEDDRAVNWLYSENSFKIYVLPKQLYIYTYNGSSLTRQPFKNINLTFLDILEIRVLSFKEDRFLFLETQKLFCAMCVEYYFKAKQSALAFPKGYLQTMRTYMFQLLAQRACGMKFFLRMFLFLMSPYAYEQLVKWKYKA